MKRFSVTSGSHIEAGLAECLAHAESFTALAVRGLRGPVVKPQDSA